MLLCLYCGETYDKDSVDFNIHKDWNYCPKTGCDGYLVDIDEELIPHIKLLNSKGYATKYCCQGHVYNSVPHLYIMFEFEYDFEIEPPKGFTDSINDYNEIRKSCIEFITSKKDEYSKSKDLSKARIDLLKWIQKLPCLEQ